MLIDHEAACDHEGPVDVAVFVEAMALAAGRGAELRCHHVAFDPRVVCDDAWRVAAGDLSATGSTLTDALARLLRAAERAARAVG